MAAESNVGARLLLIGKDGVLAGIKEITAATARLNAEIASGAGASKTAAAGYGEQAAGLEALQLKMATYETQLGVVNAETNTLAKVGKVAFFTLAAAGAAWTYESIKWAQNYQTALVQLRTQAGLTVVAMNQIGAAAMRNAASLGISPTAYLQAAYHPASTGYGVAQTIAITNYGAKLAAIGGASPEDTVNSLTATTKAFGFKTSQTEHTAALLNAVVGAGNMHWSDLNSALSSGVASTAKTFGVGLPSVGGALARLTDIGTPAAQAGTRLRMALALIGGPSQQSDKLLTAVGLDTSQRTAAQGAMASALVSAGLTTTQLSGALRNNSGAGGIYNALELLHNSLKGMSPEAQSALLSRAFGGGRMGTSIMQLYNNLPALKSKSAQIQGGATNKRFMEDWAKTTETLNFQLHRLGGELQTIGTAFGKDVLPYVTDGVKLFTDLLSIVGHNKVELMLLGTAVTAILVPAIGLYLKRALLSSEGAIMSVFRAYQRLIFGQTEEQLALQRTNIILAEQTGATNTLATADERLGATSATAGRTGGLAGLGGGVGGILGKLGLGAFGAYTAGSLIRGSAGSAISTHQSNAANLRTLLGDAGEGAIAGGTIGSVIPIIGTGIGATAGALAGTIYGERHQIASALTHGWDDLFGGGSSAPPPRTRAHIVAHVYIDGKDVTAATKQNVQRTAARK
jgi:TP901 family phage tail tape measure protein